MAFWEEIEDQDGKCVASLLSVYHKYLLPDGSKRYINDAPAWCHHCGRFVMVEDLVDPDLLRARAIEFCSPPLAAADPYAAQLQGSLERRLREVEQWRIVLNARRSPPRCLECGGTNFLRLREEGEWVDHPADPGRRVRVRPITSHVTVSPSGNLYDGEGNRIPGASAASSPGQPPTNARP